MRAWAQQACLRIVPSFGYDCGAWASQKVLTCTGTGIRRVCLLFAWEMFEADSHGWPLQCYLLIMPFEWSFPPLPWLLVFHPTGFLAFWKKYSYYAGSFSKWPQANILILWGRNGPNCSCLPVSMPFAMLPAWLLYPYPLNLSWLWDLLLPIKYSEYYDVSVLCLGLKGLD